MFCQEETRVDRAILPGVHQNRVGSVAKTPGIVQSNLWGGGRFPMVRKLRIFRSSHCISCKDRELCSGRACPPCRRPSDNTAGKPARYTSHRPTATIR